MAVHDLVADCPPLDLNSRYAYFLQCSQFAGTCTVAEDDGRIVGFLSAHLVPEASDRLFVWQVAVDRGWRGRGLALDMLEHVLARPALAGVRHVEATVTPSNAASRGVFRRFAERRSAPWEESPFLTAEAFGGGTHEAEVLIRIGPFQSPHPTIKQSPRSNHAHL